MAKELSVSVLLDLYEPLLTERQAKILHMYYDDDLSLAEIAQQFGISRQGIHDTVKKGEKALKEYEDKLGLLADQKRYVEELREFKAQALDIFNECRRISLSRPIAEKTVVLLENLDSKLSEFDTDVSIDE